jgi:NAD(P) transhydrogenase subunit beta
LSLLLGVLIIVPIGGADMPVVILDAEFLFRMGGAGIGFTLGNTALIITGALVGSSGAILSSHHVQGDESLLHQRDPRRFGGEVAGTAAGAEQKPVKLGSAEDAAFLYEERGPGDYRAGLRHGGGSGPACVAGDG